MKVHSLTIATMGVKSEELTLPISDYQWWFTALQEDNVVTITETLSGASPDDWRKLINGRFVYLEAEERMSGSDVQDFHLQHPLAVVACYGALQALQQMLDGPLEIFVKDDKQNNIIHLLVELAQRFPEKEQKYIKSYKLLCEKLPMESLKKLLYSENANGFRPLEMAAGYGTLGLLREIMHTKEVYLVKEERRGIQLHQWFDISDYENMNGRPAKRMYKSPLQQLTFLPECVIQTHSTSELFTWGLVNHWTHLKGQAYILPLAVWGLLRLFHIVSYFVMDYMAVSWETLKRDTQPNSSLTITDCTYDIPVNPEATYKVLSVFILVMSSFVILFDIGECAWISAVRWSGQYEKVFGNLGRICPAVSLVMFRGCQFITAFLMILFVLLRHFKPSEYSSPGIVLDLIRLAIAMTSTCGVFYFVQLLPSIGHFVITIQRMLYDLFNFIFVYVFFLVPFAHAFMVLIRSESNLSCVQDFHDYPSAFYNTFLTMLNMIDYKGYELSSMIALCWVHIAYIFMIAVLLLNFLIAIFSNSVTQIFAFKETYITLERISAYGLVEARLAHLAPCLRKLLLQRIKPSLPEVDGKLCVICVTLE